MKLPSTRGAVGAFSVLAVWAVPLAWAAPARAQIEATYQQDRAACLDGRSQHERSSCLREAGAVRAESRAGHRAPSASTATLEQNALRRCQDLPRENQVICERMVRGEGSASGSVAGGGLIRELVTEVPAAPLLEPDAPARMDTPPAAAR